MCSCKTIRAVIFTTLAKWMYITYTAVALRNTTRDLVEKALYTVKTCIFESA